MDTRISLLRIIQEALTNVIKHAKAKRVGVLIYEEQNNLHLVISDDGKGISARRTNDGKSGMGLQSIRRRVQLLNGKTDVRSDENGTEIMVIIPVEIFNHN
ncbi:sensor histidine kinase [Parapedobacter soli]|uniref:sensor histidine kinase n=1 Tax=Parapedobacter soli TaxID=416955 RepID=UPI0021C7F91E|nr:ATP-binding protein [Parapedobacter soli]